MASTQGAFVIIAEFEVRPEAIDAFLAAAIADGSASVANEPGCRQFDVCVAPEDPAKIVLYEVYDDRAAFEAHLKTPHFLACKPKLDAWLESNKVRFLARLDPA